MQPRNKDYEADELKELGKKSTEKTRICQFRSIFRYDGELHGVYKDSQDGVEEYTHFKLSLEQEKIDVICCFETEGRIEFLFVADGELFVVENYDWRWCFINIFSNRC